MCAGHTDELRSHAQAPAPMPVICADLAHTHCATVPLAFQHSVGHLILLLLTRYQPVAVCPRYSVYAPNKVACAGRRHLGKALKGRASYILHTARSRTPVPRGFLNDFFLKQKSIT